MIKIVFICGESIPTEKAKVRAFFEKLGLAPDIQIGVGWLDQGYDYFNLICNAPRIRVQPLETRTLERELRNFFCKDGGVVKYPTLLVLL